MPSFNTDDLIKTLQQDIAFTIQKKRSYSATLIYSYYLNLMNHPGALYK